jgi:hypothetical protein
MEPFAPLSFPERVRYDRFVKAYNRRSRCRLQIQRSMAEARLDERKLHQMSSLPAFATLSDELRGLLSFPFIRDRAISLRKAIRNLARQKSLESGLAELRRRMNL